MNDHKYNTRLKNNTISRIDYSGLDENTTDNNIHSNINSNKRKLHDDLFDIKPFFNTCDNNKNINIILNMKDVNNNIYNNNNNLNKSSNINDNPFKLILQKLNKNNNDSENEDTEDETYDETDDETDYETDDETEDETDDDKKYIQKKNNNKQIIKKNYKKFSKLFKINHKNEEFNYFTKQISIEKQNELIDKFKLIQEIEDNNKPLIIKIFELDIPDIYKKIVIDKFKILRQLAEHNNEYHKLKTWIDTFMSIPFHKYNNLPVSFADGIDKCNDFIQNSRKILDNVVFGLNDAKIQIIQMIGLLLVNPNAIGTSIAIKGPPGTGKTTLIKEGLSQILQRPNGYISLGGNNDSSYLVGHDYTYEGSKYGKILSILIQTKIANPIIIFDELDKVSDTEKGKEIIGVLTHLIDSTQNMDFEDKYMCDFKLDMSKTLFVFTYNDETLIDKILLDRMYKIETKGYNNNEKIKIALDYLIPKIALQINLYDIQFDNNIIEYIINNFTNKELGVRNLKRCFEIIYTKLNLYRLSNSNSSIFDNFIIYNNITFPLKLTEKIIDTLIKKTDSNNVPYGMYT